MILYSRKSGENIIYGLEYKNKDTDSLIKETNEIFKKIFHLSSKIIADMREYLNKLDVLN